MCNFIGNAVRETFGPGGLAAAQDEALKAAALAPDVEREKLAEAAPRRSDKLELAEPGRAVTFDALRRASQRLNIKLREVAERILGAASRT